jgi:hypothetical protein
MTTTDLLFADLTTAEIEDLEDRRAYLAAQIRDIDRRLDKVRAQRERDAS